jgi:hypothetical protein
VIQGMIKFNESIVGPENSQPLFIVRYGDAEMAGGLIGFSHWNWLYITYFWLAEEARGVGIGSKVLFAS